MIRTKALSPRIFFTRESFMVADIGKLLPSAAAFHIAAKPSRCFIVLRTMTSSAVSFFFPGVLNRASYHRRRFLFGIRCRKERFQGRCATYKSRE